jgi:hypothetical protein
MKSAELKWRGTFELTWYKSFLSIREFAWRIDSRNRPAYHFADLHCEQRYYSKPYFLCTNGVYQRTYAVRRIPHFGRASTVNRIR